MQQIGENAVKTNFIVMPCNRSGYMLLDQLFTLMSFFVLKTFTFLKHFTLIKILKLQHISVLMNHPQRIRRT